MKRVFFSGSLLLITIVICHIFQSCNSTQLLSSWTAPSLKMTNYKKVLVIGLMGEKDVELRQDMEIDMTNALRNQGIMAYSAFATYGPTAFKEKDPRTALHDVNDHSFDAILCMVLIDKDKEQYYVPGTSNNMNNGMNNGMYNNGMNNGGYNNGMNNGMNNNGMNNGMYNNGMNNGMNNGGYFNNTGGFQNYYNQGYNNINTQGYYNTTINYTIETDIFDFHHDTLIYSAETKTYSPNDLVSMSNEVTKAVINDMVYKQIIPNNKKR